ncbi:MAG: leucyl/phenylalanyl-tRNA--protein transferase [Chlorobi bacterium]|nr:leucyl/phenylalanyl-tRNA--protein transferase [Chlorobiota bacterium]
MPIFQLTDELIFPHPALAENGILAVGGDLSPQRLILAYQNGIFPWYSEEEPIIWHAPDPRFVLFPEKFKKSKSLRLLINKNIYSCSINKNFEEVIKNCRHIKRKGEDGTWITDDMEKAYINLHKLGFAVSVEVYNKKNELAGGLYGIKLGKIFFGESMFSKESNTSKIALAYLIENTDLKLIDAQVHTNHLENLGAEHIALNDFLDILNKNIQHTTKLPVN